MKKISLIVFALILVTFNGYSQITFEKGYYINNSGQKVDCLIKNLDWKNSPTKFHYQLAGAVDKKEATIKSVKEFEIYNASKYVRATVNIDRSSESISELSSEKRPEFTEEELFLKVLVEGKSNLYQYSDRNLQKYFYSTESGAIEQLIFKSYKKSNLKIAKNNRYRQQLWTDLKCSTITLEEIKQLEYKKNELVNFFVAYSKCNDHEFINFEKKHQKNLFSLNVTPGIKNSSLSIQNYISSSRDVDFSSQVGFRLGIEAEVTLPFNKNKWAVLVEPTYQYFKSENETGTRNATTDYQSIELSTGLRHYFFLNENSKIFINGSLIYDFNGKSTVDFDYGEALDIGPNYNFAIGLGYKHHARYSLELRYQTSRKILVNYFYWDSDYKTLSAIFGYKLF